jgi:hypothetical protein
VPGITEQPLQRQADVFLVVDNQDHVVPFRPREAVFSGWWLGWWLVEEI